MMRSVADRPEAARPTGYEVVRLALGLLLLTAAALKGHQLATEPVGVTDRFAFRQPLVGIGARARLPIRKEYVPSWPGGFWGNLSLPFRAEGGCRAVGLGHDGSRMGVQKKGGEKIDVMTEDIEIAV